jgi:hypothetical protein
MVKEIARHNGPLFSFVTSNVEKAVRAKLGFVPSTEEAAKVKSGFIKYGDPENK